MDGLTALWWPNIQQADTVRVFTAGSEHGGRIKTRESFKFTGTKVPTQLQPVFLSAWH